MSRDPVTTGHSGADAVRRWTWAALGWCGVFAVPHVVWAAGGRSGLGDQAEQADVALATWWFAAYNLLTALLCGLGVVLAVVVLRGRPWLVTRHWRLLAVVGALLAFRAAVGLLGLTLDLITGTIDSPPLLIAVEGWFVLGAIALGGLARAGRTCSR